MIVKVTYNSGFPVHKKYLQFFLKKDISMKSIKRNATFEDLGDYLKFVRLFAGKNNFNKDIYQEITLAIEELLVNIILYAYPKDSIGKIELSLSKLGTNIVIKISDSGIPFNILKVKKINTNLSLKQRPLGGMGILFVKKMMDKIEYERKANKNILTLFKSTA